MKLDEYLKRCEKLGYDPKLPPYFDMIVDRALYQPSVIAEITKVSTETARRWFRTKKLTTETASHTYKVSGRKLKEFLFSLPRIQDPLKAAYPEIFELESKANK
ncbi:hypothetical protein [Falsibacillus pallidus]|uniref:hypothetical protein n=1 Tax=Falsibacillus pallidus TaxID=493781 RepID=UPI003D996C86